VIADKAKSAATQKTLNTLNSKSHIRANGTGAGDIDTTEIPPDVLRFYRELNPGKTMEEYLKHYKQSLGK
jgi:hypothetical protein